MLTKKQQCVFDWLNDKLQLPVFAGAYKGALLFLNEKPPGYITFVAHAGRDLMNRLAADVAGIKSKQVQYNQHVGELQKLWKDEWAGRPLRTPQDNDKEDGHLIPYGICQKLKKLIDEHEAGSLRSEDAGSLFFSTFLDYSDRDKIPKNFLGDWKKAKNWFNGHAHLRKKDFAKNAPSEVARHFQTLDDLLYVAASSEFERIKSIDEILEETNE